MEHATPCDEDMASLLSCTGDSTPVLGSQLATTKYHCLGTSSFCPKRERDRRLILGRKKNEEDKEDDDKEEQH